MITSDESALLTARSIRKSYPGVVALGGVDLTLRRGHVHALMGENGAGKSTLVKVITGAVAPDSGSITVGGRTVSRLSPREARSLGIAVVHQERQIAPDLSVAENVLLGRMPINRFGIIDHARARTLARRALDIVGLDLDPRARSVTLGVAQAQALEIARALSEDARILVLDEPTSAIGGSDAERLFEVMRQLRDEGMAIVLISHHLEEVFAVSDTVTTMRDGVVISSAPIAQVTPRSVIKDMLGDDLEDDPRVRRTRSRITAGPAGIDVDGVSLPRAMSEVSVRVARGEIVGVAGGLGSGRRELARLMAGAERPSSGTVSVSGARVTSPRSAVRRGLAFLPQDRKREALMLALNIADNISVGALAARRSPLSSPSGRIAAAVDAMRQLRIKASSPRAGVETLSGGNQQKVVLARWTRTDSRVFVLDEPTAGIDVRARAEIHEILRGLADGGAAVAVFSSDLDELCSVADRVVVMRRGQIVGELAGAGLTRSAIASLSSGVAQ